MDGVASGKRMQMTRSEAHGKRAKEHMSTTRQLLAVKKSGPFAFVKAVISVKRSFSSVHGLHDLVVCSPAPPGMMVKPASGEASRFEP